MRRPTPHWRLPARAVSTGLASAMFLAACGGAGETDAGAERGPLDGPLDDQAPTTAPTSTIPAVAPQSGSDEATADGSPGLPVASDQAQPPPTARTAGAEGDGGGEATPTSEGSAAAVAPSTKATPAPSVQPAPTAAPTTQAPTTPPPAAANLPNLAVVDLGSGSSIGFPQAARSNGLPVVLWFWSPT